MYQRGNFLLEVVVAVGLFSLVLSLFSYYSIAMMQQFSDNVMQWCIKNHEYNLSSRFLFQKNQPTPMQICEEINEICFFGVTSKKPC